MPTDTPTKPKQPSEKAEPNVTETSAAVSASEALIAATALATPSVLNDIKASEDAIAASRAKLDKPPGKLGAEKLTPEEQRRRFIDAARETGASEDEADFDAALKRIAKPHKPSAI